MSEKNFPIIGIGASAGGLEALTAFFDAVPVDSGMAFIVITHHDPKSTNLLPEILKKYTKMPVEEIKNTTPVKPDRVYTSPPSHYLAIRKGVLVFDRPITDKIPLPIDFFFRSLAEDQEEKAVCILLSGTCSDGTLGVQAVKGENGMAIAQDPKTAQFSDMPKNAIATGLVDYVLAPQDMPEQLSRYSRNLAKSTKKTTSGKALNDIIALIRQHTGSNFDLYKTSTLERRIERRMHMHQITDREIYVQYLKENAHEIDLLFKDILIGVTSFFRDPDAFTELEKVLVILLKNKVDGENVRIWSAGCSTGEEAYSLAILLHEYMERENKQFNIQIFATDLDENAINRARLGVYSEGIALDISTERLEKYFDRESNHYRIKKNIREKITFAIQNLIQEPPFTKLDLISCRNLLIYLDAGTQKKIIPLFHYALRQNGILFLGSSESIGTYTDLFIPLHGRSKMFLRKEASYPLKRFAKIMDLPIPNDTGYKTEEIIKMSEGNTTDITLLAQKLLLTEQVPPSLIVNEKGDIVFVHGRTGLYLELMPGQPHPRQNILDMAREGLQLPLAAIIRKAASQDMEVVKQGVRVLLNGNFYMVTLRAHKISQPEPLRGLILIVFENEASGTKEGTAGPEAVELENDQLEQELQLVKKSLQSTIEEREMANEQLKSSNEELQSTNEELQSANEELETAKEEMQSLNEELQTVNAELEKKINDLSHANDDMKNLLDSTGIATIFLDKDLNVKRFTSSARKIVHLIPSDIGRPISDIVTQLEYEDLVKDAAVVLDTLNYKEQEVRAEDWSWYLMRILPYRTAENVIDGLVVTFVDITQLKKSEILLATNIRALEMISLEKSAPDEILDEVLHRIESQTKGIKCAVSLLNKTGAILKHAAGPSLPAAFCKQIDEIKTGSKSSEPSAKAVHQKKSVIMKDLTEVSPATSFTKLALKHNIKAVWSQPIHSSNGDVMGAFSVYYDRPHSPYPMEKDLINQTVPLMSTILSRHLLEKTE